MVVCENIFTIIFVVEMAIKCTFLKWAYFRDGANWLDCFIVVVSILDCWVLKIVSGDGQDLHEVQILRIVRLVRLVRVLRVIKHVKKLVIVIRGVVDAFMTTFWTASVVFLTVYVGAIFCTEFIGRGTEKMYPGYTEVRDEIDEQEIMQNFNPYLCFGSMTRSMFTLFNMAILAEWAEVVRPIKERQPLYMAFFLLFVMFTTFWCYQCHGRHDR